MKKNIHWNNRGLGSGVLILLVLIVSLIVVWLTVQNMSSLGVGGNSSNSAQTQENYVQQAQDVVNATNDYIHQQYSNITQP